MRRIQRKLRQNINRRLQIIDKENWTEKTEKENSRTENKDKDNSRTEKTDKDNTRTEKDKKL